MKPIKHQMQDIRLTSAETGHLWNTYMLESMVHHMFSYFLKHVEDINIKDILEINVNMTYDSLGLLKSTFKKENLHVPRGILSEDLISNAPRLYSDVFYVVYLNSMAQVALMSYSIAFSQCSRQDMREFFKHYLDRLVLVNQQVTELMLQKGIYVRLPYIPTQHAVDFVKNESFLAGFIGDKRPLTVFEITNIFSDAHLNAVGKALLTGFIQVVKSKELQQYFVRGKEISNKYFHNLTNILLDEDISVPPSYDGEVMDSTETPFSDRLMLLHITFLTSVGLGSYGRALSSTQRHDLTAFYVKIMAEAGIYAHDALKLMIQNEWMEQPPLAPDRKAIYK